MKITEFIFIEHYRLNDRAFAKCMNLWRKISKFDNLVGNQTTFNVKAKVYTFFEGYCNVYFIQNQNMNFFEDVHYKGYKKFKRLVSSRFSVINELFARDSESSDKFIEIMLGTAGRIFLEVEVSGSSKIKT